MPNKSTVEFTLSHANSQTAAIKNRHMKANEMKFEITLEQMAFFTNAVVERDRLRKEMRAAEIALQGKKEALRRYQAICEKNKKDDLQNTVKVLVDVVADGICKAYCSFGYWREVAVGILKEIDAEKYAHDERVKEAYLSCL